jgi:hypothetical protein
MSNTRPNVDWDLPKRDLTWEHAQTAVLMDIRRELQTLNRLLHCKNFTSIPQYLRDIRRHTTKPKKKPRG